LVEEIPRKKQFQCRKSIKNLGNAKQESSTVNKIPESGGKVYKLVLQNQLFAITPTAQGVMKNV
jgi:hypothetical protein